MKKIKILHVTFDMNIGGAQQVIRQLVENMDQDQFEMDIACIGGQLGEIGELLKNRGVNIELFERQSGLDGNLIKNMKRFIQASKYQIIHCHQYTPYVYGLLSSLFTPAKIIFTEHGRFFPDFGTWKRKLINPVFSVFTSQIVAIAEATKDALVRYENFDGSKIDVIYNGVKDNSYIEIDEGELRKAFHIPEAAFLFGTISRLEPIKNQAMMINAFKKAHDQHNHAHLLIVGDGEIRGQLEKQVCDLGLDKQVTFTGFQKDPSSFYSIIDVFLLSSFSEGTSMTLLEAMSFSKPCVATEVGGNPELIKDQINGLIAPSDDTDKFFKACNQLICDISLCNKYGGKAREKYLELFSVNKMIMQYAEIYKNILR
jgi:glycosyltransferase involved in cell wall biosynthesis